MRQLSVSFENADSAEWALAGLRSGGTDVLAFRIDGPADAGGGTGYPYAFSSGPWLASFSAGNYFPGVLDDTDRRLIFDTRSAEVILSISVADGQARKAEQFLISRHGRIVPQLH